MARLFRGPIDGSYDALIDELSTPSWAINGVFRETPNVQSHESVENAEAEIETILDVESEQKRVPNK